MQLSDDRPSCQTCCKGDRDLPNVSHYRLHLHFFWEHVTCWEELSLTKAIDLLDSNVRYYPVCYVIVNVWLALCYNLGQNKMRNKTPPPPISMMNSRANQNALFFFRHWNGGRGDSNFSFVLTEIDNPGQNKMRNKTPLPPSQWWIRAQTKTRFFFFRHWNGGRGDSNFSFVLTEIVAYTCLWSCAISFQVFYQFSVSSCTQSVKRSVYSILKFLSSTWDKGNICKFVLRLLICFICNFSLEFVSIVF